ncbi:MAG: P-II family nitrogen regulator [Actinomycetota bacterium]|nr:P-II family nitrogen regulator [Actinomycetota bacterium]
MRLITAVIRPEKLGELIEVVIDNQAHGLTVTDVRGFGRQLGQRADGRADADPDAAGHAVNCRAALRPKVRLEILVLDDDAETLVEAIAKHAGTETIGDGKIWVSTVDSALRVRTGQRDRDAV